ncbi:hypothetical protein GT030_15220 [Streptomyces sp. SID1328]|uniref:nuclear transport factor 2 family protein n=1 Tax=Streptomyces sp. SID1328 TaxID=2690250 RepID=UPI00137160DC|nr:nuclear transport factor 2 family protein [Streptomyces sp. SID1328]MYV40178.1 hypothetical protein [Streptomyces sp. SID1328]
MITRAANAALAVAALSLTACSSPGHPAGEGSDADKLTKTVQAYNDAYFAGDAETAYAVLSKRCHEEMAPDLYAAIMQHVHEEYGSGHPAQNVKPRIGGDLAQVTYTVQGLPQLDQHSQPWAREDGAWKYDAC